MVSGDFSMDSIRLMYPDCTRKHFAFPVGGEWEVAVMHMDLLSQLIFYKCNLLITSAFRNSYVHDAKSPS